MAGAPQILLRADEPFLVGARLKPWRASSPPAPEAKEPEPEWLTFTQRERRARLELHQRKAFVESLRYSAESVGADCPGCGRWEPQVQGKCWHCWGREWRFW
jgi:hypothetical protein